MGSFDELVVQPLLHSLAVTQHVVKVPSKKVAEQGESNVQNDYNRFQDTMLDI
eukprot:CAMPEP_0203929330 /NCGR_PEP_ID=MMETSP0359-20131031/68286_1 /ASSEMBLY_ACC=CAM_ASM_000338 /TAXON_ID=268821 /ORGANISM="Scrippsiella Hangoei, Strain SHTV-5" /LENGTH=52 /DNA_ID=CAMNT_0050858349 /DNA_START=36 /DNA_END=191 /DNA_ORIENTATION=-